jgi:hypothetical protein
VDAQERLEQKHVVGVVVGGLTSALLEDARRRRRVADDLDKPPAQTLRLALGERRQGVE